MLKNIIFAISILALPFYANAVKVVVVDLEADHGTRMANLITPASSNTSIASIIAGSNSQPGNPIAKAMQDLPANHADASVVNLSVFGSSIDALKIPDAARMMPNTVFVVAIGNKPESTPQLASIQVGAATVVPSNVIFAYALDGNQLHPRSAYPDKAENYSVGINVNKAYATSQATAILSGSIASMREQVLSSRASDVVQSILSTAQSLGDSTYFGKGIYNPSGALAKLKQIANSNTPVNQEAPVANDNKKSPAPPIVSKRGQRSTRVVRARMTSTIKRVIRKAPVRARVVSKRLTSRAVNRPLLKRQPRTANRVVRRIVRR